MVQNSRRFQLSYSSCIEVKHLVEDLLVVFTWSRSVKFQMVGEIRNPQRKTRKVQICIQH